MIRSMRPIVIAAQLEDAHDAGRCRRAGPHDRGTDARAGVIRVICPPFVCLARGPRRARRRRTSASAPRTSTTSWPARTPARSSAPMLAGPRDVGDPRPLERRARRRRDGRRSSAASSPGGRARAAADPVRRRAAGGARGGPRRSRSSRGQLARVARRAATPATRWSPRPARDRLRAGLGDRDGPQRARRRRRRDGRRDPRRASPSSGWGAAADDVPVLYGGSVTSANIGEFLAEPAIDGALVGGASLKPDEMAGIVARAGLTAAARGRGAGVTEPRPGEADAAAAPPAADRPRRPRRLRHRRDPAADAIAAAPHAGLARAARALAARASCGRRRTRSGCRPARWATPRSATSTSAPAGPCSRTCRGSTRRIARRLVRRAPGAARRLRRARAAGRAGCTSSAWSGRAASTPTTATSSPSPSWPPRRGVADGPGPRAARRPRHAAALGARRSSRDLEARARGRPPGRPDRDGRRALLRRWTATSAGTGSSAATTRSCTGRGSTRRAPPRRSRPPTPAARTTSSSQPTVIDGVDGTVRDGDADRPRQLPRRPRAPADPRPRRRRRSTASTAPARRPAAAARPPRRDDDRVRGGPAGRGRLPARGGAVAGGGVLRGRLAPVPRRRDREVRPRHVLLQRRPRGSRGRARSGVLVPEPAGSRPTTCSPR